MMESMSIYPTKSEVYAVSRIGEVDIPIPVHYSAPTECKGNCINVNRLVAHLSCHDNDLPQCKISTETRSFEYFELIKESNCRCR